jgi:DNA (cytosine-5)-methyltransferase 1
VTARPDMSPVIPAIGGPAERARHRVLDVCCGAGGASAGYGQAGYGPTGVDLALMPNYPFEFIQADALEVLEDRAFLDQFDLVHASPPCQRRSRMTNCRPGLAATYPDLIDAVRARLVAWGGPWALENVAGSGLAKQGDLFGANGLLLCGTMFRLPLYRHRLFETSFPVPAPQHPRHLTPASKAGHWEPGTIISVEGNCSPIELAREAMAIGWMRRDQLKEAIPPPYARYIGTCLLETLDIAA